MELKLFDSERKVMEVLWDAAQDLPAREVARRLEPSVGWNKNTTYTVIKKCVEKEAIERREPNFQCHPLVSREQVREQEAVDLVDKFFDGSASLLFASLVHGKALSREEIDQLKKLVDDLK